MAPLEPITFTVHRKPPVPAGDRSLGSPVYSSGNTEGNLNSGLTNVEEMSFQGIDDQRWRVVLVNQNVFMNKNFKSNYLAKLRSFLMFKDFWDGLYKRVFGRESRHKGNNLSSHMKTTLQLRNFIYVCHLMIVAEYLKKEDTLLHDELFRQCFRGVISWYLESLEYDRDDQNYVLVGDDSLSIHDSRGTERLGNGLIGPRVVSSITTRLKYSDISGEEGSDVEEIIQDDDFLLGDGEDSSSADEELESDVEETDGVAEEAVKNNAVAPVVVPRKHVKRKCHSQYDTR
eukprot:scaffold290802_cov48-Attheya_sp.AAC.2